MHDWSQQLRCPATGLPLEYLEPWLLSNSDGSRLFPVFCKTHVLQENPDAYLTSELQAVARAMAEFGESEDVRHWFFSRYNRMHSSEASGVDADIVGEGYPGFWQAPHWPKLIAPYTKQTPEEKILATLGEETFGCALDLGSGQGGMTYRMAAKAEMVFGVEQHFYLAALANQLLQSNHIQQVIHDPQRGLCRFEQPKKAIENAVVLCASVEAMPFEPQSFDWVHIGHLLDLLADPAQTLADVIHLLKPNGLLTICSPMDFPDQGHFDEVLGLLSTYFQQPLLTCDGIPWLRPHHKRRFILHEDWLWMGRLE